MNTDNYEQFATARPSTQLVTYPDTYSFTLDPSDTGFYIAIRDSGTCVGISRLRVYHYICQSRQVGLVLYPEALAPISGSVNISFSCVDNAHIPEDEDQTTKCNNNGEWDIDTPVCECNLGFEDRGTECFRK